jgi:hypothetical protein
MELETGTRAIIALAWARRLELPDSALHAAAMGHTAPRVLAPNDAAGEVVFLRLLRGSALAGPSWILEAAEEYTDDELAVESTLVRLVRANGGGDGTRGTGELALYYLDEPLDVAGSDSTVVSMHAPHALELESQCPRDDVADAHLSLREHTYTLLAEEGHTPLAGAGYDVWNGLIADLCAITVPALRRHGLGAYISAVAVDDALTQGLIPQWRAGIGNRAAHLTAQTLGFLLAGSVTSVRIA